MIKKTNYHTHTTFCDGKDSPEIMVQTAIKKGFSALGFSGHSIGFEKQNLETNWHIPFDKHFEYVAEIKRLANLYRKEIEIFCGFEADYIKDLWAPTKENYKKINPDYLIGSVHYVFKNGEHYTVDGSIEEVKKGLEHFYKNDGKEAVCEYFALEREMLENCSFDIIGHPDLIRKRNNVLCFFDESENWYKEEIKKTAYAISVAGCFVEINTGGIARGVIDDVYPSEDFLKELFAYDVPIVINSDAHSSDDLDFAFDRAKKIALKCGYTKAKMLRYTNTNKIEWVDYSLS